MLKRILAVTYRDLVSGIRQFMVPFILAMPFVIALVLRALVPGVGSTSVRVAVLEGSDPALVAWLEGYAAVETVRDRVALEARILKTDDVFGVVETSGGYEVVRQGSESADGLASIRLLLDARANPGISAPVEVAVDDIGWRMSPLKLEGTVFLLVFCTVFGGMLIALALVEEKMSNTLSAVNVAPLSKAEFVVGKSILGFLSPLLGSVGVVLIMGFGGLDVGMAAVTLCSVALISILIGFGIGVVASEPIQAIASMKTMFLPVFASVFGGIFLAQKWQWVLYWSPHYWAYRTMKAVLLGEATWPDVLLSAGIILAVTAIVFLILGKRIRRGLR